MSKEILKDAIVRAGTMPCAWMLYFFKIDRRSRNPYIVHKVRFRNGSSLQKYAEKLTITVVNHQIEKLEKVQLYTGENSKVSCDKIALDNELIKNEWEYLFHDLAEASDQKITGKYNGYILTGIPMNNNEPTVTFIKMANPVIEMQKQNNIIFRFTGEDELDLLSDEVCRLYMNVDMVIIRNWLYAFNFKMETLFNMEKTMQKVKEQSIEHLLQTEAFSDEGNFLEYANSYPSARTFLTLSDDRMQKLRSPKKRKEIADILKLKTDKQGRICIHDKEEASLLIRYMCFKIFKDYETKGLLEASNVTKVAR